MEEVARVPHWSRQRASRGSLVDTADIVTIADRVLANAMATRRLISAKAGLSFSGDGPAQPTGKDQRESRPGVPRVRQRLGGVQPGKLTMPSPAPAISPSPQAAVGSGAL